MFTCPLGFAECCSKGLKAAATQEGKPDLWGRGQLLLDVPVMACTCKLRAACGRRTSRVCPLTWTLGNRGMHFDVCADAPTLQVHEPCHKPLAQRGTRRREMNPKRKTY